MNSKAEKLENLLGIDFGIRNIGLAISQGVLAEPLTTLKVKDGIETLGKIKKIINDKRINKVIIGISEKETAKKTRSFASQLRKVAKVPVVLWDETLTTWQTRQKMLESGKPKTKRATEEHQVAACLILSQYLDSIGAN